MEINGKNKKELDKKSQNEKTEEGKRGREGDRGDGSEKEREMGEDKWRGEKVGGRAEQEERNHRDKEEQRK